jgi:sugar phosphate isomerase/epimerase
MNDRPLAAWLPSYTSGLRAALELAVGQGYRAVHTSTTEGELDPRQMSRSARRHLRKYLQDVGVSLGALAVEHPGAGLADPARADERFDQLRQTLALCTDLGVRQATVNLGGFEDARLGGLARELLGAVAESADRYGITTSINDPAESPESCAREIAVLGCPQLRLALDTAALAGREAAAGTVAAMVGSVYLRDARRRGDQMEETAFGRHLLGLLESGCEDAALVVRRDASAGVDALLQGREYMQSLLGHLGTG